MEIVEFVVITVMMTLVIVMVEQGMYKEARICSTAGSYGDCMEMLKLAELVIYVLVDVTMMMLMITEMMPMRVIEWCR